MPTPAEITDRRTITAQWAGSVPTFSGKRYRPWDENPGELNLNDLAYGLAHKYRYGGQSTPAITVAEHCLLVGQIIEILWPGNPRLVLAGLLHDASEAVLHDIQGPLRGFVQVTLPTGEVISWNESDKRVTRNIARQFGITAEELDSPEVKAADLLGVCFEKRDCPNLREGDWGLPPIPDEVRHLKVLGLPPEKAAQKLFQWVLTF